jgi:TolB-like protein
MMPNKISQFWQELKRRNVVRVITVYAGASFVILELVDIIAEPLSLPSWLLPVIIVLLSVGFIIAIILSWIYDIHPEDGIVKTELATQEKAKEVQDSSNSWKIASYISFVVIVGLILLHLLPRKGKENQDQPVGMSIAVLPFEDMSPEQDQEYFCDGISEEIINSLAQLPELKVIARTSSFSFKGRNQDIREIARSLGVETIVEGSVQKIGEHIRITAQLIHAEDGIHLWSGRFDRKFSDLFAIQDEISRSIVENLKVELLGSQKESSHGQTDNMEAYQLYLQGRYFWHRRTKKDLQQSMKYYQAAIKLDSTYALAYAGLADVYFISAYWRYMNYKEGYESGKKFAMKAISLEPDIPDAYATLGGIATWYEWDWEYAEEQLQKALQLNPNYANGYQYYSELLHILGDSSGARKNIDEAIALNPNSTVMFALSSMIYYNAGEFEEALAEDRKSYELALFNRSRLRATRCLIRLHRYGEAVHEMKTMLTRVPGYQVDEDLDSIYLESGIESAVHYFLSHMEGDVCRNFYNMNSPYMDFASIYAVMDDPVKTLEYIEKAYQDREANIIQIFMGLDFRILSEHPRYQELLSLMNLKE